jgi:V/A-type H+-transporting ATPase subunit I
MLKPEEMTRAVVVGSIDSLDATIECLYELGALHLIDFTKQDEEFKLGQPLPQASEASQRLLKLRSMIRTLQIDEHKPQGKLPVSEINAKLEQALVTLDLNTTSKAESRQKIQTLIREKESEIRALTPFKGFGIPVEDYEGYDNISAFAGTCKTDPSADLGTKIEEMEIFKEQRKGDLALAVFVRNEDRAEAARILAEHEFQEVKLPKLQGDPAKLIATNLSQIKELEADLKRIEADIESIRKQFADFIISSEEHLAIEVLKAETPLRIAASANSFVIDGWLPTSKVGDIQTALDALCCGRAFIETVQAEKEEEPPTKLKNPKPVGPFELFISMVSTPKYEEIDPTIMLFITFPLFFGFMIGDLGFGAGLMAGGFLVRWKAKGSPDLYKFGTIILAGGLLASIFGLLVFAEAFGVPFHPPAQSPDEASWESVANIPIHPLIDKMHDVNELLALSMLAGWAHLTVGLCFGFANKYHHSKRHALAKIGWLLILLGLFEETMAIAGDATMTSHFINSTVFGLFPHNALDVAAISVSVPALALIVAGIVILPLTEGPFALTEVTGIFTNLISYARLAALAVGKGGMALAFNTMLFPLIFESGNIAFAVLGVIVLVVTQLFFVFFLGALSAGIQAIRLNYVEFFLKFFEGGGTEFSPLRYERKYSVIKE